LSSLALIEFIVMAGLGPAIHAFIVPANQQVDAPIKSGHDVKGAYRL
jgi:hypothetical protein